MRFCCPCQVTGELIAKEIFYVGVKRRRKNPRSVETFQFADFTSGFGFNHP
ncbi:Uncharacterised protein [Salmonella enterica subsp. enterica]|uniref:Uncharacterized protein n=1 Tax=Salmonella enterica I TaxID=59201 RepID=A0A447N2I4_SALET|nr:Uncharacterised protein [Salmonella enterica subsp. enterica]